MFGRLGLGRFGTRFRVRVSVRVRVRVSVIGLVLGLVLGLIILWTLSRYYCAKRLFSEPTIFSQKSCLLLRKEKSLLAQ